MAFVTCYIALGSNLPSHHGSPEENMDAAISDISKLPQSELLAASPLYQTSPVGGVSQPDFINAVISLSTALTAHDLLCELQSIEARFGRCRIDGVRDTPRPLDLDLLLYGNTCYHDDQLILPHPRLHLRAFVVYPLCDIAPEISVPKRGKIAAWHPAVAGQGIWRLSAL